MSQSLYWKIGKEHETKFGSMMGQMFGKPCLKSANKNAYAAFYKENMVFKLGIDTIQAYKERYSGAVNWDPSSKNRPMKEWLQVPNTYTADWEKLAQKALAFVK